VFVKKVVLEYFVRNKDPPAGHSSLVLPFLSQLVIIAPAFNCFSLAQKLRPSNRDIRHCPSPRIEKKTRSEEREIRWTSCFSIFKKHLARKLIFMQLPQEGLFYSQTLK